MVTEQERNDAEVARAEAVYIDNPLLEGTDLQAEVDARIAEANATHTAVDNDELATDLNVTQHTLGNGGVVPVYSGGNVVNEESPHPTVMDGLVREALDEDRIFTTGGQVPPTSFVDENSLTDHLDPMWLVESAKKTGEKPY